MRARDYRDPSASLDGHPFKPRRVYQGDLWHGAEPVRYTVRWVPPAWWPFGRRG